MSIAPARRKQATKSQKIRILTAAGKRLRAKKAEGIADQWMTYPRRNATVEAVQYCSKNGGVAAAVVILLNDRHGVLAAMAFAKQVASYGRSNSEPAHT